jgi:hypothetical protein
MIELSTEQQNALKGDGHEPLRLVNPTTKQTFVLLPAEAYEQLIVDAYDSSPWSDEEMDLLATEDADRLGWEGTDAYQERQA